MNSENHDDGSSAQLFRIQPDAFRPLREKLTQLLPHILPEDPEEAIKGTELIDLCKNRGCTGYSDATLRYHFSIMCCDQTSPIAKVEHGQGYYLRDEKLRVTDGETIESLRMFEDLAYRIAVHMANPTNMPMMSWGVRARALCDELRELDPQRYEKEMVKCLGGVEV